MPLNLPLHHRSNFSIRRPSLGPLWALAPAIGGPYVGTATTKRLPLSGKQLLVNVVTRHDGNLRAELLDSKGAVIAGYSRDDCRLIAGDETAATVEWNGGKTMPDAAVRIRFYLKRAFLYGFAGVD